MLIIFFLGFSTSQPLDLAASALRRIVPYCASLSLQCSLIAAIEEERPYVGEVVWALFFAYRSFNMRLVHLARQSLSTPGSINWSADAATRGLLAATLSAEEIAEFDRLGISKVDFVRRTIEGKVLSAWHRLISGAEFGEEALRHAHALLKVVSRPA